jgi:histidinol-phosphatase
MTATHPDLAFAHRLADAADAIALRHFGSPGTSWRAKSDGSPVSLADEQIEHTLRNSIQRERPDDGVLGEEFGAAGCGPRRWIIDAIDGTASFLAGEPEWSTLIALEDDGTAVLGLVSPHRPCAADGGQHEEPARGHKPRIPLPPHPSSV